MGESVRFIFKTLIRVPVIIMVCFIIFNLFAFGLSYMKMLGLSYVVMQTAMENNYIPDQERDIIENYINNNIETVMLEDVSIVAPNNQKRQYGSPVTVGVQGRYKFILPFTPAEQIKGKFEGINGDGQFNGFKTDSELQAYRQELEGRMNSNIRIVHEVPGFRYYPDLN